MMEKEQSGKTLFRGELALVIAVALQKNKKQIENRTEK